MYGGGPCGRPVIDGEKCICHSENPDKDVALLRKEVDEQLARDDRHDFISFVFPDGFSFEGVEFPKNVYFLKAKFSGVAHFSYARFSEKADFRGAEFSGEADFTDSKFSGMANFGNARFSGSAILENAKFSGEANFVKAQFSSEAWFNDAQFSGEANFSSAKFSGEAGFVDAKFSGEASFHHAQFTWGESFSGAQFFGEAIFFDIQFSVAADFSYAKFSGETLFKDAQFSGEADFSYAQFSGEANFINAEFSGQADFQDLTMAEKALLTFDHVDLHNCHFFRTDISRLEFSNVKWPRRRKLFGKNLLFRRAVADELDPVSEEWEEVGNIYRGLQVNYTNHNRYADASHFYVAEMDINRKTNREWRYLIPSWFYRKVSLYGQSYLRPFMWLMLVLLLFPAIILWGGINPSAASDVAFGQQESISYTFSLNPADCFLFQGLDGDYWTVFFKNISFLTFSREKLSAILLSPFQEALAGLQIPLIVTLIAFFLLALRRQFKRKSF